MTGGLTVKRYFTKEGVHPYDEVEWDIRDAVIPNFKEGGNAFEQREVEFPTDWSQNATNIVAQKYFRGPLGTPQRERSVRQLIDRVADTITSWGWKDGYFANEEDRETFNHELKHILVTQKAAFNSPVWFNVGVEPQPAVLGVLHPRRRRHDGVDPQLVRRGRHDLQGRLGLRHQPVATSAPPRRSCRPAVRRRDRSRSCGAPTPPPGRSSPAARPGAPRRWSC